MNDVCWKIVHAKNTCCPWWEPDEVWCAQWKLTHLPSSGMNKQPRRNGVYQTNDGNDRKSCAVFVRVRASVDDAHTGKGNWRRTEKWEAGEDGGGPTLEGVCVRRIPKLKHKEQIYTAGTETRTKNFFTSCHADMIHLDTERSSLQGQTRRIM